jgi:hypothetical protein
MNEKPIGIALVVCEQVISEAVTNKKTLVGLFNQVSSKVFPFSVPKICVFVSITGGKGNLNAMLKCVNENDGIELFKTEGPVPFKDPNQVVDLNFELINFPFPQPGLHSFDFYCDDALVLQRRFNVIQVTEGKKS